MNNILIIGSKGFIGTKVESYFKNNKDYRVYTCDVVVDYNTPNYFLIDSTNSNYERIFRECIFDVCINCSGAASVPDSLLNPARDFDLNTHNVFKILSAIKNFSVSCRFINLSSAAVYGNPKSVPIVESQDLSPMSPYGSHKLMAEMICRDFHRFYNLKTISLRIFSAYGEGLRKQLFWDLHRKANNQEEISLFGTGKESRDFIHVDDLTRLIHLVSENATFDGEAINAANGEEIFIKNAVATYYSNFENKIDYKFSGTERRGDPINWVANISRISEFGYKPSISFKEGLKRYYKWAVEKG